MSQQLCLFKFERPLLDRFGAEFFRAIPRKPGIYLFFGARGRTLYVGQSKNLRERLSYYKNAQPEREPRKIIRLVHETKRIEVRRCESAEAAQIREAEMIRENRPKFNAALTASRAYSFFTVGFEGSFLSLRLSVTGEVRRGEKLHGAFKNRGLCRRALLCIGRVLWAGQNKPATAYDLPLWLHERSRANQWEIVARDECFEGVDTLLAGASDRVTSRAADLITAASDPFLRKVFESDLLVLTEFFELAKRMRRLRIAAGKEILQQQEIDPLQIKHRIPRHNAPEA
jgi:hypothetical protein